MVDQGYKSLQTYLNRMLESCTILLDYTHNISYDDFIERRIVRDACLMQLQHLGETAFKIDKTYKHQISDYHKIIGLRHIISHDYLGITHERLRTILTKSIPILRDTIEEEIKKIQV